MRLGSCKDGGDGRPLSTAAFLDQLHLHPVYGCIIQQRGAMGKGVIGDKCRLALPGWICHQWPQYALLTLHCERRSALAVIVNYQQQGSSRDLQLLITRAALTAIKVKAATNSSGARDCTLRHLPMMSLRTTRLDRTRAMRFSNDGHLVC